ncbi:MAG TPA: hypothetical protein VEK57_22435 [Thermoanaerobaculia bacterium]|nr:hypothetical protein [Thermoanaerobaculia bacterium]
MIVQLFSVATGAVVLAAVLVLAVIAWRTADLQRRATGRALLLIYLVGFAPALIMSALWWRDAMRIMIELHGIAFRSENGAVLRKDVRERTPGGSRVLIGDVPARRRRIPQTLFGTFVFRPASGDQKGALAIELPAADRRAGVIATSAHGILGAQEIEDGDRICIGAECWTYDEGDDSFTSGTHVHAIPPRQAKIPGLDWIIVLPFATPVTSGARTYSIDFLARHGNSTAPAESLRSFLCYSRPGPDLRLVSLDASVTLRKANAATPPPSSFAIAEGTRIHLYTLPPVSETFDGGGLAERRSVVYRGGARSFALDFDTPEIHSLSESEFAALHVQQEESGKAVALAMGDAQLVDRSLYFAGTSESVALQSSALIELPRFFPHNIGSGFRIVSPRGPADATLGRTTWIGASDLAAVRMSVVRPPLLLLLAALVLQLLKIVSASAVRFTYAQALLAGAVELLVGVRLLFGHRVWAMPPYRLEAAELGAVAWMALPWIFIVASIPVVSVAELRRSRTWVLPLIGLLFSTIFCARLVEGPKKLVWIGCHLLAVGAVLLRSREARDYLSHWSHWSHRSHRSHGTNGTDGTDGTNGTKMHRVRRLVAPFLTPELTPLLWWSFAFFAARFLLLLFGFKESAMLPGGRISLSAAYVPAAAVLQGIFLWRVWQRVQQAGKLQLPDITAAIVMMTLVWALPAVLTSDIGLALLNVPVFLLLLYAVDRKSIVTRLIIAFTLIVVAGAPVLRVFLPMIGSEETLLSLASDSNYARFFHSAAPEQLQQLATKRGESLAITSAILQRYIGTGLFGVGYGHTEVSPHLGDTALRDFAPAVFVAAEWGLAGTVAMLTLYLLFGYVAWRLTPWGSARRGAGFFAGRGSALSVIAAMAALTITVASVYMILANHELVLLTGKNAYLLGLDSAGDVLETVALLLVIAYCFAFMRDTSETLPGGFR